MEISHEKNIQISLFDELHEGPHEESFFYASTTVEQTGKTIPTEFVHFFMKQMLTVQ